MFSWRVYCKLESGILAVIFFTSGHRASTCDRDAELDALEKASILVFSAWVFDLRAVVVATERRCVIAT